MFYPARSSVIGNVVCVDDRVLLHNRPVHVGGVDNILIHVHHRGVIGKRTASPLSAGEADAPVPKAVVNAAVVAHVRSPVAAMEPVVASVPVPIIGSP
jgi:hypothetical protein